MAQVKLLGLRIPVFRRDAGADGWELWVCFDNENSRSVEAVGIFSKTLSFTKPFSFYDTGELTVPTLTARMQKQSSGWQKLGEYNLYFTESDGRYKFVLPDDDGSGETEKPEESISVPPDLDFRA